MRVQDELMIDVIRSGAVESQHVGSIAVVDLNGNVMAKLGDPYRRTFIRSSAKPLQAIPTFADDECMKRFKFTSRERAFLVASHSGDRRHQKIGQGIMEKLGITVKDLRCGVHPPFDKKIHEDMNKKNEKFTPLCHNCSGNHMVMIALSIHRGWSIRDYTNPEHPYQQEVLKWVAILSNMPMKDIQVGTDGCSAPVYYQTLREMALTWAVFSSPERLFSLPNHNNLDLEEGARAMRQVVADYWKHPEIIGGVGRFDTRLNRIGKGSFFAKGGGEGLELLGFTKKGIGIAVKMLDGDPLMRAKCTAVVETLQQLGLIKKTDFKKLQKERKFYRPKMKTFSDVVDYTLEPRFQIKKLKGWKKII